MRLSIVPFTSWFTFEESSDDCRSPWLHMRSIFDFLRLYCSVSWILKSFILIWEELGEILLLMLDRMLE